jgi:hypothetical protein
MTTLSFRQFNGLVPRAAGNDHRVSRKPAGAPSDQAARLASKSAAAKAVFEAHYERAA